jgi:hypothetical protein
MHFGLQKQQMVEQTGQHQVHQVYPEISQLKILYL